MKRIIEIRYEIELEYDPDGPEFLRALREYRESINRDAQEENMLKQIAWHVQKCGANSLIEGCGYVKTEWEPHIPEENEGEWCGVTIVDDDPGAEIEIY